MDYRQLGKSSLTISRIGFGCMSLQMEQSGNRRLLHKAVDCGINYFDTADLYDGGENEKLLGKLLKEKRKQVIIATKVGNQLRADNSGWDWNPSKTYIISAVEKSLQRLQTDYIDLYQLHGGTINDPINETIEAFELLVEQGKIRYYGISSIRPNVIKEYVNRSQIASVMMQYSLLDRRAEETCLPLLEQNNIGVLARGSVAGGLLAGKPAKPYLDYTEQQAARAADAIRKVAGRQRSLAATAIGFTLHQPAITAAVVGIRTEHQLQEAIAALAMPALTSDEIRQLHESLPVNTYSQHR